MAHHMVSVFDHVVVALECVYIMNIREMSVKLVELVRITSYVCIIIAWRSTVYMSVCAYI